MKKKRTKWFHRQKLKCLSTDSKCPNFESRLRLRASISNKRRQDFFLPNWSNYPCSVFSSSFSRDLIRSYISFFCFLSSIWLNISDMFSFSLNLIRSSSFFFFLSLSMWSNYLSCFFPRFINWGREKVCACQTLAVGERKRRILKLFTFSTFWWLRTRDGK